MTDLERLQRRVGELSDVEASQIGSAALGLALHHDALGQHRVRNFWFAVALVVVDEHDQRDVVRRAELVLDDVDLGDGG